MCSNIASISIRPQNRGWETPNASTLRSVIGQRGPLAGPIIQASAVRHLYNAVPLVIVDPAAAAVDSAAKWIWAFIGTMCAKP
ncbi:hypothetical protein O1611_g1258 [Lasiodiplodia mahajangana]|uniref:Uncharacterized protein n=1 Tax=Lasiodiplodia mahajangana TaxID=1108764 RepID=A0ACC2JXX1_9PEZI|nr:hypothetical protein O1611_g1258 [Lasiodiplodia mahajangana]